VSRFDWVVEQKIVTAAPRAGAAAYEAVGDVRGRPMVPAAGLASNSVSGFPFVVGAAHVEA